HRLTLDDPVWARYVRFTTDAAEEAGWRRPPRRIRVREAPAGDSYRSILGEWGFSERRAVYEWSHPPDIEENWEPAANTTRAAARPLSTGETARGVVRLGETVNWYRLDVAGEHNTLSLELGGHPTVRTVVWLEDEAGAEVPLRRLDSVPQRSLYEAVVEPGATYYLRVEEPPRSVAFLWDTSPSVRAYLPLIYSALSSYAGGAVPGRDAVNFMPFGSRFLMNDWHGEPYRLQTVVNEYPHSSDSSDAEGTMADASEELGRRPGTKAIVMVTDAACPAVPRVWDQFESVRPRIFAVGVSSAGAFARDPAMEQDRMEIWSSVHAGHYQHALTQGAMEVAFDRASTLLRDPAPYSLKVDSRFEEAPGPGTLTLVWPEGREGEAPGGAVELILDASGSMHKRLGSRTRIEVAKEVLTAAVDEYLPSGTPLAVRVFGNVEANSCRTDVLVPLAPLDSAAVSRRIAGVVPQSYAKTPIADSLRLVESDLRGAQGRRLVVLVTDGEETCGGDPARVIAQLRARGVDLRVNIVGFAIDDADLESQFR
ncbi:MAG: VWA domain-containing protein, partial [Thermoanaerobaculia bacterium]|nr:VWA domain-containing protein [Thermoanaerobaculia bacterium]